MAAIRDESGELRHFGAYPGLVVDNLDPMKRGRVKVLIPGLCEPSTDWALPVGGSHSSGEPERGGFDPPKTDAAVVVMFLCGDVDSPVYLGGWRGSSGGNTDAPSLVQAASAADAANSLKVYESDKFVVVIDERAGSVALSLRSKINGVELDIREDKIEIKAGGTLVRVKDLKIQLGGSAQEGIVKGTTWWTQQDAELTALILALQAMAGGCVGPTSALQPGVQAQIAALQAFQNAGAAMAFISKLSFTE